MAKPPASHPSFSHFATGSSPFLQLALCSFPKSLGKSRDQVEEALPQKAGTGLLFPFFFSFFFFKTKSVLPFPFLLQILAQALKILSLLSLKEL